ncbi:protein of unknown function [Sporobacter termitidis DSM 10068]|uniref:Uncharacterized protein n=1 Tax=Sporobacter termitidis DSM 10068 TaxID=1123282 RepID=A0A1M5Z729_9FIRM|nr:DUF4878 domain-containing protein [Sporobacter termitidis]SHI20039.1 protein of unknown function [Sporobacter termitidis DSM 10068]
MKKLFHSSRYLSLLIVFVLMISVSACSEPNYPKPEESVKGFFDALSKSDLKTAETYTASGSASGQFDFSDSEEEKIAQLMLAKTGYELVSSEENGDKATVKIKVTSLDMSAIFEAMMTDLIDQMTEAAFSGEEITDEQSQEMTMKYLEESMSKSDAPVQTNDLTVTLNKDKGKKMWVIVDDDTFLNGITGNLNEMLEQ